MRRPCDHGDVLVPHDQRQGTEPVTISVEESEAGTTIVWKVVPDAIKYDIIRGDVRNLRYSQMSIYLASYEDNSGRSGCGTAELGNPRVVASGGCR
jgi:hypothetical protein